MSKNNILIFTDLEGTLLRESDGAYDEEEMYKFISAINELQKELDQKAYIHIVSPMTTKMMKKLIDKIDKSISRYNLLHKDEGTVLVRPIGGATVSPETKFEDCIAIDERFIPMPKGTTNISSASYGKEEYVKLWVETVKRRGKLGTTLYLRQW